MRALLGRELRGATLWAALQCLFGVLANLDHALWRPAHTTTEASLHVFDGDGATALAVIELALAFVMAQRVMLREAEEGTLGALDALPVARWQPYAAKVAVCLAMVLVGAAAASLGNALWTALAPSSLAPMSRSKMQRSPLSFTPIAITTAIETIRWFWRTLR